MDMSAACLVFIVLIIWGSIRHVPTTAAEYPMISVTNGVIILYCLFIIFPAFNMY